MINKNILKATIAGEASRVLGDLVRNFDSQTETERLDNTTKAMLSLSEKVMLLCSTAPNVMSDIRGSSS